MSICHLKIATEIQFGFGAFKNLMLPPCPVLVLTGQSLLEECSLLKGAHQGSQQILVRPGGEPSSATVDELASKAALGTELILAIGGGSTIDAAKGVALLLGSGGHIADFEFGARQVDKVVPVWAVPTTCGSGSEVTPYSVINNSATGRKFTLASPLLQPKRAFVDPELLKMLDPVTFVAGCLDAFIHAFEARLSVRHNPLIDPFAKEAMQLIWNNLPEWGSMPETNDAWEALAKASTFGGLAIGHSRTGLVHTLCVALAKYSAEPHGLLNARLLPYVLHLNQSSYQGMLAKVLSEVCGRSLANDTEAIVLLKDWLGKVMPPGFILGSAAAGQIGALTDRVEQDKGLPDVNPSPLTRSIIEQLLREITRDAC